MTNDILANVPEANWAPIMDELETEICGMAVSFESLIARDGYGLLFVRNTFTLPEKLGTRVPVFLEHDANRRLAESCKIWGTDDGLYFSAKIRDAKTIAAVASRKLHPSIAFSDFKSLKCDGVKTVTGSFLKEISLVANPACSQAYAIAMRNSRLVRPVPHTRLATGRSHQMPHGAWHRVSGGRIF